MTNYRRRRGITLIELVVSLAALSILVLYFAAFEQIARQDLFGTERRARVQTEASLVLEHIGSSLKTAIGKKPTMTISIWGFININFNPIGVNNPAWAGGNYLKVWTDFNNSGTWESGTDRIRAYKFVSASYRVDYYAICNGWAACSVALGSSNPPEVISRRITNFTVTSSPANAQFVALFATPPPLTTNFVTVSVTACWDPDGAPNVCGHQENPQVQMTAAFSMPGVPLS